VFEELWTVIKSCILNFECNKLPLWIEPANLLHYILCYTSHNCSECPPVFPRHIFPWSILEFTACRLFSYASSCIRKKTHKVYKPLCWAESHKSFTSRNTNTRKFTCHIHVATPLTGNLFSELLTLKSTSLEILQNYNLQRTEEISLFNLAWKMPIARLHAV
jgi:hypothetical protein